MQRIFYTRIRNEILDTRIRNEISDEISLHDTRIRNERIRYNGNGTIHPSTCPKSLDPRAIALNGYNLLIRATEDLYVISSL